MQRYVNLLRMGQYSDQNEQILTSIFCQLLIHFTLKYGIYDENHKNLAVTKNLFTFTPNKC